MRAFLLRRVALISAGLGDVIVLGSQHSSNTLRLREFLTRNGHPYSYVDLDTDKASQELLDRFDIKLEDIPVVICSGKSVLRNPTNQRLAECLGFTGRIDQSAFTMSPLWALARLVWPRPSTRLLKGWTLL